MSEERRRRRARSAEDERAARLVPSVSVEKAASYRRWIFAYNVVVFFLLLALAWAYFLPTTNGAWSLKLLVPEPLRETASYAFWFGALGGIAISLKGVYDHGARNWQTTYNLWHFGRPVSGAIAGAITYLLLKAVSNNEPNLAAVLAAAFILGTQERRFFNFLSEVAKLVVQVPGEQQSVGIVVTEIHPETGAEGEQLTIMGRGFDPGLTVWVERAKLENVVVSRDGTTITGDIPEGAGEATIRVENPDGSARVVSTHFTYKEVPPPPTEQPPEPVTPAAPPAEPAEPAAPLDARALAMRVVELEVDQAQRNAIKEQFERYIREPESRTVVDAAVAEGQSAADVLIAEALQGLPQVDDELRAARADALQAAETEEQLADRVAALEDDQRLGNAVKAHFERYIADPEYRSSIDEHAEQAGETPADRLIRLASEA